MSQEKEIIKKLVAVANKQRQVITKLAQSAGLPLAPQDTTKKESRVILNALPPNVRSAVARLEVAQSSAGPNTVKVQFAPGKGSVMVFNTIKSTVTNLQNQNALPGASYNIVEVK